MNRLCRVVRSTTYLSMLLILALVFMPAIGCQQPEPAQESAPAPEAQAPTAEEPAPVEVPGETPAVAEEAAPAEPALSGGPNLIMVPMTDGVKLATDVYIPETGAAPYPAVLVRSVYGRGLGKEAENFNERGYAFVVQDTRGRGGSEGKDNCMQADGWSPDGHDGKDTVEWILAQPWCNGEIATYGMSALAMTQMLLSPATDKLAAQYMDMCPASFYGQVAYQGGVFRKSLCEGWLTAQGIAHVVDIWHAHPSYDEFWTYYDAGSRAGDITAPGMHIAGWYDIFQEGTIRNFQTRQHEGGPGAKDNQILIIKWSAHGADTGENQLGDLKLNPNRFDLRVSHARRAFIDFWMQGEDGLYSAEYDDLATVYYYVMGDDSDMAAPGMHWRTADDWPPFETQATPYYLAPEGMLTTEKPAEATNAGFAFDPAKPFPTHGGQNLLLPYGAFDQRKANQGRDDFLAFTTEPLEEAMEVTGKVVVKLHVSTDAPDTDFTAKLIDIYPEGDEREILMLDNIQRVKYRNGFEEPAPLLASADEVVEVEIDLCHISWIFNKGHRIGLQISSSNSPRFEVNPNNGDDFMDGPSEPQVANNVVHMGDVHASALILPVRDLETDPDGNGLTVKQEWAEGKDPYRYTRPAE